MTSPPRTSLPGLWPEDRSELSPEEARSRRLAWLDERLPRGPLWILGPAEVAGPLVAAHPGSRHATTAPEPDPAADGSGSLVGAALLLSGARALEDEDFWQALERRLLGGAETRVVVADRFRTRSWRESGGEVVNRSRYLTALAAAGFRLQRSHDLSTAEDTGAEPRPAEQERFLVDELRWDGYRIRSYRKGDEAAILDLFQRCFHRARSEEQWRWKYRNNPWGSEKITLVFSPEGSLVGQYCAYPVPFAVADGQKLERWLAFQIGDTMIAPEARSVGRGPTSLLARATGVFFARYCEGEIAFDYGVNTGGIHRYYLRFVGGHLVEPVAYRLRALTEAAPLPRPSVWARRRLRIERVRSLDALGASLDRLMSEVAADYRLLVWRDRRYLQWRYLDCPEVDYRLYAAWRGRRLLGWSVFLLRGQEPGRPPSLLWGDALFRPPDAAVAPEVLRRALADAPEAERLEGWFPERPQGWQQVVSRVGLEPAEEPNDLRLIMLPFEHPEALERMRRELYYTSGDTDLF